MNEEVTINIVDSVMGAGKTSAAINYIKNAPDDMKFMYITPYLTEVGRIKEKCANKKFVEPINYTDHTPKKVHLKHLLNNGRNIITTHALFHHFDDEIIDLCYSQGYVLFMDEVTDVIDIYELKDKDKKKQDPKDVKIFLECYVDVDEKTGLLHWKDDAPDYDGLYATEKNLCDMGCLALYGCQIMLWLFPIKVFRAFRKSYILTYMFNAQIQKYYYDYYLLEYNNLYVSGDSPENFHFVEDKKEYLSKYDYRKLINIIDEEKLNMIGDDFGALSKAWYSRNQNNILMKKLKNNMINFFNNKPIVYNQKADKWEKSKSDNNIWTTFKAYKKLISGKWYAKGYLPSNMRATNEYKDRTAVAYMINKYFNPCIKNFFLSKGIEVDEDGYALSEMLQFLWRSAIREGRIITVYIPSSRMRNLLIKWIEDQKYGED